MKVRIEQVIEETESIKITSVTEGEIDDEQIREMIRAELSIAIKKEIEIPAERLEILE
jgi:hypothetical protein